MTIAIAFIATAAASFVAGAVYGRRAEKAAIAAIVRAGQTASGALQAVTDRVRKFL